MKFKDIKNILSCTDIYEISIKGISITCDYDFIDEIADIHKLNERNIIFIKACGDDSMYIALADKEV